MIPDYQTIMQPLLEYLSDKKEHTLQETVEALANHFSLTEDEQRRLLPSGTGLLFRNRVQWARLYLDKAKLIETPKRATYRITNLGLGYLAEHPNKRIDTLTLLDYPDFREFYYPDKKMTRKRNINAPISPPDTQETHEEMMENAYASLNHELQIQVLDNVKSVSPIFFESLVVDLLISMGYGGSRKEAAQVIGKSGDEGVDGVIKEDKLGLDTIYIQAKRWDRTTVGRRDIQQFVGALKGKKARKGIFITTSTFTKEALEYASSLEDPVILIDGIRLAELMIIHNVGVSLAKSYEIKTVDSDYFSDN